MQLKNNNLLTIVRLHISQRQHHMFFKIFSSIIFHISGWMFSICYRNLEYFYFFLYIHYFTLSCFYFPWYPEGYLYSPGNNFSGISIVYLLHAPGSMFHQETTSFLYYRISRDFNTRGIDNIQFIIKFFINAILYDWNINRKCIWIRECRAQAIESPWHISPCCLWRVT